MKFRISRTMDIVLLSDRKLMTSSVMVFAKIQIKRNDSCIRLKLFYYEVESDAKWVHHAI